MTNRIHPTAIIGPNVELGANNIIGPYAVIYGPGTIGDDTFIGPHVAIGTPGEISGGFHGAGWEEGNRGRFSIGDGTIIREFVTVQVAENAITSIGSGCYVMTKAHIPHHAAVADNATIACLAVVGGHGIIGEGAYLGLSSVLHQRIAVGAGAMIGMGGIVTKHVPPFATAFGSPVRVRGANRVGMQRSGYDDGVIERIDEHYRNGVEPDELFADPNLTVLRGAYDEWLRGIETATT